MSSLHSYEFVGLSRVESNMLMTSSMMQGMGVQVKAVRDAAKPYTKSVGRNAKRLSMAASGAFVAAGRRMSTPCRAPPHAQ